MFINRLCKSMWEFIYIIDIDEICIEVADI